MNNEHKEQCEHIDHNIFDQVKELGIKIDYNNKITENLTQQISGVASDLKAFKDEMKPWLEAKIGLSLLWKWLLGVPAVIAILIGIKTLLEWFGFRR